VLTLPAFPTSVLGTVVNKRAKYNYLRLVQDTEQLTYRCGLAAEMHAYFRCSYCFCQGAVLQGKRAAVVTVQNGACCGEGKGMQQAAQQQAAALLSLE